VDGRSGPPATTARFADKRADEFEALYRSLFSTLVRRAMCRYALSFEDARDVVQDAFAVGLEKIDFGQNPPAWLHRVVDYLSMNVVRKNRRRINLMSRWATPALLDFDSE
jgi:DNA-directed RNA polymerase specialized sigma24 family protein